MKTNFDEGRDHLDMFLPFVVDAIRAYPEDSFTSHELSEHLQQLHGLRIPDSTVQMLLTRARKTTDGVRREAGRYFKTAQLDTQDLITPTRRRIESQHSELAEALIGVAREEGVCLSSPEDALVELFSFLAENEVAVLLDGDLSLSQGPKERRLVARFLQQVIEEGGALARYLQRLVEGFVLQSALLLTDVNAADRRFRDLTVYLDSGIVFRVLGLYGDAGKVASRDLLAVLKANDASSAVFESTLEEVRRILSVYERNLATAEGRHSLRPYRLTRFLLSNQYHPSDIRQAMSLLERNLRGLGVRIHRFPERKPEYTLDEQDLTERLKRPEESDLEPRVVHDVDCTAAVLTLREGREPDTLDDAHAVFVTSSPRVVETIESWYRAQGCSGVSPIIRHFQLSTFAWLKRPEVAEDLKIHELAALCSAALQPSRVTWERFLRHLRKLEDSGELDSDDAIAVVVIDVCISNALSFSLEVLP